MHKITSDQFKTAVELDPAWASKLTEPTEVTARCDMISSEITHLSPMLQFTKDENGYSANFINCKSLKVAEGKFEGFVNFHNSGIEKIGDLTCGKDEDGHSAYFAGCKSLKVAKGKFQGYVTFSGSNIEKIGDLSCGKDDDGYSAEFRGCKFLKIAKGKFEGFVSFAESGIEKIRDLTCGKNDEDGSRLDVQDCPNLAKIPRNFNPKEVKADPKLIERLEVDRFIQKKREEIVEIEI